MLDLGPNSIHRIIRDLLIRVDLPDPHEFATAYVEHAEARRAKLSDPMPVSVAVQRWLELGSL